MTEYELMVEIAKKLALSATPDVAFAILHQADIEPKAIEDMYIEYLNKQGEDKE